MRRLLVLFVALCELGWGISAALAETRVALVVGNSAYRSTTPLANPLNDARDMAAALKSVGFDVVEALDADKRKLDGAMRAFTLPLPLPLRAAQFRDRRASLALARLG